MLSSQFLEGSPPSQELMYLSHTCSKVNEAIEKLSKDFPLDDTILAKFYEENDFENRHVIGLAIVDDMAQYMAAGCVTQPPIDIISSRYEQEPYKKTINEVKKAMLCGYDVRLMKI